MSKTDIHQLGIIDFRNIVSTLKEVYNLDFSNFAFTSFKRRLEKVIKQNNLGGATDLVVKIRDDANFYQYFLQDISVEETEMFRDPALWRELRNEILSRIQANGGEMKIWVSCFTTGEELYSLAILLRELNIEKKVKIIATSISKNNIKQVKSGVYNLKKMETNIANYKRYKGQFQLTDFYDVVNHEAIMKKELLENVEFQEHNLFKDPAPNRIKMVLYRNKMIYFNKRLQSDTLRKLYDSLLPGGYLVIGIKEMIDASSNIDKKFILVNESESIYKKAFT